MRGVRESLGNPPVLGLESGDPSMRGIRDVRFGPASNLEPGESHGHRFEDEAKLGLLPDELLLRFPQLGYIHERNNFPHFPSLRVAIMTNIERRPFDGAVRMHVTLLQLVAIGFTAEQLVEEEFLSLAVIGMRRRHI